MNELQDVSNKESYINIYMSLYFLYFTKKINHPKIKVIEIWIRQRPLKYEITRGYIHHTACSEHKIIATKITR
jgi:hypothetical protein